MHLARVQAPLPGELAQVFFKSSQARHQATSKEQRSKGVALVNPARTAQAAAAAGPVPEVVLGGTAREKLGASEQLRRQLAKLLQASLPVRGAERVLRVERQQHQGRVRLGECAGCVRERLGASSRADRVLVAPQSGGKLGLARVHQQAPSESPQ